MDALIWLELQAARHQVSSEERHVFTQFVLLPRWRDLVDHTIVMTAIAEKALEREDQSTLIQRRGTLMNPAALAEFNEATKRTLVTHGSAFAHTVIDTTEASSAKDSTLRLLDEILPVLEGPCTKRRFIVAGERIPSRDNSRPRRRSSARRTISTSSPGRATS